MECVFYYIDSYQLLNVKRDREWFKCVKPKLKETFDIIKRLQTDKQDWESHYSAYLDTKHKKYNDFFDSSVCMIEDDDKNEDPMVF